MSRRSKRRFVVASSESRRTSKASGASFADVVMVNSFHVWDSPNFTGTRDQHWDAFYEVAADYIKAPYPAWTAVGTNGLLATARAGRKCRWSRALPTPSPNTPASRNQ